MDTHNLNGLRVAAILTDGFEQIELTDPRRALEEVGARVMLLAPQEGMVQGFNGTEKGNRFRVDGVLGQANPDEFDAVLLPGGVVNADKLRMDRAAQEFVRRIDEAGRPVAVICHGPWLLISAGLVRGRRLTSYHTLQDDIRNAGGVWIDEELVEDGNWVSSRFPDDLPAFNEAMVELFAHQAAGKRR